MESVLSCFKYQTLSARKAERFLVFCISFYNNASKDTLFQLYPLTWFNLTLNTLVQCRTHTCKKKKKTEGFALRMATKYWDRGYQDFLSPTQQDDHKAKPVSTQTGNYCSNNPFAGTSAYLHWFVPHTVCGWNLLPESVLLIYLCSIWRVTFVDCSFLTFCT